MPHLHLELRFLAHRYGGTEWPPAPMRLLQALVAGLRDGTHPALAWLEGLAPPVILAEADPAGTSVRTFVPNNTRQGALATPNEKAVRDRHIRRPQAPVRYCWHFAADDLPLATAAAAVAERLHTLGTGQDMCSARAWIAEQCSVASEPERALWLPSPLPPGVSAGGVPLRVPLVGSLASIEARFQAAQRRYDPAGSLVAPVLPPAACRPIEYHPSHERPRLLAIPVQLAAVDAAIIPAWPHARTVHVAAMLRHGAMAALAASPFADWAAGHAPGGDLDARLSWVPLPSIGHRHADRQIRRAVFLARPDAQDAMAVLYQALLADRVTLRDEETGQTTAIARVADADEQQGVFALYRRPGRVWQTVTPIALPGEHATDARRTRRLVLKALTEAGIDPGLVRDIVASRHPLHPKDTPLAAVCMKAWKAKSTPLVYARIEFAEPLRGPLVIGRGRHYGLGLLCANPE